MITTAQGNFKRIIAIRMSPGEDILKGILKVCEDNDIKNGVIISGIGSINGAQFYNPIPLPDKKAGYGYSEAIVLRGPIELIGIAGVIGHGVDGEILIHAHCSLSDQYGTGHAGHMIEGNKVLLTADIVIGELEGVNLLRAYDDELEVFLFSPRQA